MDLRSSGALLDRMRRAPAPMRLEFAPLAVDAEEDSGREEPCERASERSN